MLHLTPQQFGELHQGEFWEAMRAYQEEKEADRRHMGELVRGATLRLFNLQVTKGSRITDPVKFWPMPWDEEPVNEEEEVRRLSSLPDEERDKEAEKFLKMIGKWPAN